MSAIVTPTGENRRYFVRSRTKPEPWLVDIEENTCACQEFYGRKESGCWHLDQAIKFEMEREKTVIFIPK